jgi:hypothetical protein
MTCNKEQNPPFFDETVFFFFMSSLMRQLVIGLIRLDSFFFKESYLHIMYSIENNQLYASEGEREAHHHFFTHNSPKPRLVFSTLTLVFDFLFIFFNFGIDPFDIYVKDLWVLLFCSLFFKYHSHLSLAFNLRFT